MKKKRTSVAKKRRFTQRKLFRWSAAMLIVLVAASVLGIEITSRSAFCNTCHIMNPYHDSWAIDVHRNLECVECHIPPGAQNYLSAKLNGLGQVVDDWLNRTSTKPSASVSDFACTRENCHLLEDIGKEEIPAKNYLFDHETHYDLEYKGIAIHCTTCHSHIKGTKHFEVNTNACITCHLVEKTSVNLLAAKPVENGITTVTIAKSSWQDSETGGTEDEGNILAPETCDSCHSVPDQILKYQGLEIDHEDYLQHGAACESCHRGTTLLPHVIGDGQCLSCHVWGMERITTTEETHRIHTEGEHKVECFNCHGIIKHGPSAQSMTLNIFDCRKCHTSQHEIQRTAYLNNGDNSNDQPQIAISPMFLAHVDCTGCHVDASSVSANPSSGATVAKAVPDSCDKCHTDGYGKQMVTLWQRETKDMYNRVALLMESVEVLPGDNHVEAQLLIEEARHLLKVVRIDGSWGVHNPRFTQRLLERAREMLVKTRSQLTQTETKADAH